VIHDVAEQVYATTEANFATDHAALLTAKGVTGFTPTVLIVKRLAAETFIALGVALPALGIRVVRAVTQAKDQGKRDSLDTVVWDLYAEHTDPVVLAKWVELGAEAVLLTIDRLWSAAGGLFGAGELPESVSVDLTEGVEEGEGLRYWRRAQVTCPVHDRDVV
jgi:hypothetical protein